MMPFFPRGRLFLVLLSISAVLVIVCIFSLPFAQAGFIEHGKKVNHGEYAAPFIGGEHPRIDTSKFYNRRSSLVIAPSNYTDDDLVEVLKVLDEEYSLNSTEMTEVFTAATAELTELYANLTQTLNGTLLGVYTATKDNQAVNSLPATCSTLCPIPTINISIVGFDASVVESNASGTQEDIPNKSMIDGKRCIIAAPPPTPRHSMDPRHRKHPREDHRRRPPFLPLFWPPDNNSTVTPDGPIPGIAIPGFNISGLNISGLNTSDFSNPDVQFDPFSFSDNSPDEGFLFSNRRDVDARMGRRWNSSESESDKDLRSIFSCSRSRDVKHIKHHCRDDKVLLKALHKEALAALLVAKNGNTTVQIPVVRVLPPPKINSTIVPPSGRNISTDRHRLHHLEVAPARHLEGKEILEKKFSSPVVAELWTNVAPLTTVCISTTENTEDCQYSFDTNSSSYQSLHPSGGVVVRFRSEAGLPFPPPRWRTGCQNHLDWWPPFF